ncbi:MAG: hypothetical protein ACYCW6_07180 [Candidatus Xenobia bacterium]
MKWMTGVVGLLLALFVSSLPAKAVPNLALTLSNLQYISNDEYKVFLDTCANVPIGHGICGTPGLVFEVVPGATACTKPTLFTAKTLCNVAGCTTNITACFKQGSPSLCQDCSNGHIFLTTFCSAGSTFHMFACDVTNAFCINAKNTNPPGGSNLHAGIPAGTGDSTHAACTQLIAQRCACIAHGSYTLCGGTNTNLNTSKFLSSSVAIGPNLAGAPEVDTRSSGAPVALSLGFLLVAVDRRRKKVVPQN